MFIFILSLSSASNSDSQNNGISIPERFLNLKKRFGNLAEFSLVRKHHVSKNDIIAKKPTPEMTSFIEKRRFYRILPYRPSNFSQNLQRGREWRRQNLPANLPPGLAKKAEMTQILTNSTFQTSPRTCKEVRIRGIYRKHTKSAFQASPRTCKDCGNVTNCLPSFSQDMQRGRE